MRRFILVATRVLAGVLVMGVVLWTWSRLQPPASGQRDAVALLQPSPQPAGRNAFAALWLLGRDVPEARLQRVAAADMQRIRGELAWSPDAAPAGPGKGAAAQYRDLQLNDADRALFCSLHDDCLQQVRADPDGHAALVARHGVLLDRIEALSGYDFYRSQAPFDPRAPIPMFSLAHLGITHAAQAYASGDLDAGLARACTGVRTWRTLGADADSLIVKMLGVGLATDGHGRLLAQMLAELPAGHPLPHACEAALVPVSMDELSICEAMRGEYASSAAALDAIDNPRFAGPLQAALNRLVYDPEKSRALTAGKFARACSNEVRAMLAADERWNWSQQPRSRWRMECVANLAGCILADIAAPAYAGYGQRAQDGGARLDLLRGIASLHGVDGDASMREARLRRFWADTRSRNRELRFVDGGRAVEVRQFDVSQGDWWKLPLPGARQPRD